MTPNPLSASSSNDLRIRIAGEEALGAVHELVVACYGDRAEPIEWWKWWYFGCSERTSRFVIAESAGRVVGVQPVTTIWFSDSGARRLGVELTGAMVHPAWRGRGVFRSLVVRACEQARADGAALVVTMPNARSCPVFRRLGWSPMGRRSLFLRWPFAEDDRSEECDCRFEVVDKVDWALMADMGVDAEPALVRSPEWYSWRYGRHPSRPYSFVMATNSQGIATGCAVFTRKCHRGLDVLWLVDVLAASQTVGRRLVSRRTTGRFFPQSLVVATLGVGEKLSRQLVGMGFLRVPRLLSPKRLYALQYGLDEEIELPLDWNLPMGSWDGI